MAQNEKVIRGVGVREESSQDDVEARAILPSSLSFALAFLIVPPLFYSNSMWGPTVSPLDSCVREIEESLESKGRAVRSPGMPLLILFHFPFLSIFLSPLPPHIN